MSVFIFGFWPSSKPSSACKDCVNRQLMEEAVCVLYLSSNIKKIYFCFVLVFWGKSGVLMFLFVWRLQARGDRHPIVFLADCFASSSHSGGVASGAIWLSSTLRTYWCLATKYCICWEVAKAVAAHGRWQTLIILGHAKAQPLLFLCVTVMCVSAHMPVAFCVALYLIFSIFHLSGWQFKTTKWNISEPFPNCCDTLMK